MRFGEGRGEAERRRGVVRGAARGRDARAREDEDVDLEGRRKLAEARAAQDPNVPLLQTEVESQRRKRDLAEELLVALRKERAEAGAIACAPAGGS